MSDTSDKPKSVTEDLRRSKRKKFHLDVVAVLSRRSPDFRRTTSSINKSLLKSKVSNNARRPHHKIEDTSTAPVLEPMFPLLDVDKGLLRIATSSAPEIDHSNKRVAEDNGLVVPEKQPRLDEADSALNLAESLDGSLLVKAVPKLPNKNISCYKCQATFKTNAGLGKHVKTCKKYINSGRTSLPARLPEFSSLLRKDSSSNSMVSVEKKETDSESLDDINELDDTMPVLLPECSLKPSKNRAVSGQQQKAVVQPSSDKPINNKRKPKRINTQNSLNQAPFDIKKAMMLKLEIPPVPRIIVDSPIEKNTNYIYCSKCPYKSSDKNLLSLHKALHDNNRSYQCTFCSYSSFSPDALYYHLNLHAPELSPSTAVALRKHIIANKRNGALHNEIFTPTTSNVVQRMEQVQTQQQRLVSIIKRSAGDEHVHKRIKTRLPMPSSKFYSCKKCAFRSERKENLTYHEELHGKRLLYVCRNCDYSSNAKSVRDFHERNHHFECSMTTQAINLTVNILKKKADELNRRCNSVPIEAHNLAGDTCSPSSVETPSFSAADAYPTQDINDGHIESN